ncbi:MAG: tRNA pseudouridine(38-40) synthase TruA [Deltaproteobacteria bacterium]
MRWRATIAYDGAGFRGWATQSGHGSTVQEELEKAFSTILRAPIRVYGAGRTDAGVHARGQVIAIDTKMPIPEPRRVETSLNAILPRAIVVSELASAPAGFDPRRDAVRRTYTYRIWNAPERSPFELHSAWHVDEKLDIEAMQEAALALIGAHDFASFQTADRIERPSVRRVELARIERRGDLVEFEITANAFCRGMVRNLMGQLVSIGRGRTPAAGMAELLLACDRMRAASCAPPQGLFLEKVEYQ